MAAPDDPDGLSSAERELRRMQRAPGAVDAVRELREVQAAAEKPTVPTRRAAPASERQEHGVIMIGQAALPRDTVKDADVPEGVWAPEERAADAPINVAGRTAKLAEGAAPRADDVLPQGDRHAPTVLVPIVQARRRRKGLALVVGIVGAGLVLVFAAILLSGGGASVGASAQPVVATVAASAAPPTPTSAASTMATAPDTTASAPRASTSVSAVEPPPTASTTTPAPRASAAPSATARASAAPSAKPTATVPSAWVLEKDPN